MQFTVDRQKLQKALQRVSNIIGSRSTLPLLGNVLIKAADNSLELSTTDLELRLVTTVEAEVAEAGRYTRVNLQTVQGRIYTQDVLGNIGKGPGCGTG